MLLGPYFALRHVHHLFDHGIESVQKSSPGNSADTVAGIAMIDATTKVIRVCYTLGHRTYTSPEGAHPA